MTTNDIYLLSLIIFGILVLPIIAYRLGFVNGRNRARKSTSNIIRQLKLFSTIN